MVSGTAFSIGTGIKAHAANRKLLRVVELSEILFTASDIKAGRTRFGGNKISSGQRFGRAGLDTLLTVAAANWLQGFIFFKRGIGKNRGPADARTIGRVDKQAAFADPAQPGKIGRCFMWQ